MKLPAPLRGVVTAMITPLLDRDQLDVAGLERLIENLIVGGANGLFILGTTEEAPSLSYATRSVVDNTCRYAAERVPVIVGITVPLFPSPCTWRATLRMPEHMGWCSRHLTTSRPASVN